MSSPSSDLCNSASAAVPAAAGAINRKDRNSACPSSTTTPTATTKMADDDDDDDDDEDEKKQSSSPAAAAFVDRHIASLVAELDEMGLPAVGAAYSAIKKMDSSDDNDDAKKMMTMMIPTNDDEATKISNDSAKEKLHAAITELVNDIDVVEAAKRAHSVRRQVEMQEMEISWQALQKEMQEMEISLQALQKKIDVAKKEEEEEKKKYQNLKMALVESFDTVVCGSRFVVPAKYTRRYQHIPTRNDKAKVLAAMQKDPYSFGGVCVWEQLKSDRAFILEVLHSQLRRGGIRYHNVDEGIGSHVLENSPQSIRGDREIVEMALRLSYRGYALKFATDELRGDRELVRLATQPGFYYIGHGLYISSFAFASEELRADRDMVLEAIQKDVANFQFASEELKNDRAFIVKAMQINAAAFGFASEEVKSDRAFIVKVLQQWGRPDDIEYDFGDEGVGFHVLEHSPQSVQGDREIVEMAVRLSHGGCALQCASDELTGDRELVRLAIHMKPLLDSEGLAISALSYASEELQADRDLVLEAIGVCPRALGDASEELRGDREVVQAAIQGYRSFDDLLSNVFEYVSWELLSDPVLVLEAVQQDGYCLADADDELQGDREVVQAAIQQNGHALQYASLQLRADREMVWLALRNPRPRSPLRYILYFVSKALKNDRDIIMYAVKIDGNSLLMASPTLQLDPCIVGTAVTEGGLQLGESFQSNKIDLSGHVTYQSDTIMTLWVNRAIVLCKELEARGADLLALALSELVLDGPTSIKARLNQWLQDMGEKIFLLTRIVIGSPGVVMGLPGEVIKGGILEYSGLKEDRVVAMQVMSFGTLLEHLSGACEYESFKICFKRKLKANSE